MEFHDNSIPFATLDQSSDSSGAWHTLLRRLPHYHQLDYLARRHGALVQTRKIKDAQSLLRLLFLWATCSLSLRSTAAWAELTLKTSISDVALLYRFANASDFLRELCNTYLRKRFHTAKKPATKFRVRVLDGSAIEASSKSSNKFRLHLDLDLSTMSIQDFQFTDYKEGAENFTRWEVRPNDLILGDRGYCQRSSLQHVLRFGGDFLIRYNPYMYPLETNSGAPFDLVTALQALPKGKSEEWHLYSASKESKGLERFPVRLVAKRKTRKAAKNAMKKAKRKATTKGRKLSQKALFLACFILILTSLDSRSYGSESILELYRFRWQVELLIKRWKGVIELGELPVKKREDLAKSYLYTKLLACLLLEEQQRELVEVLTTNRDQGVTDIEEVLTEQRGSNKEQVAKESRR